jgi:hypothetical protein
LTAFQISYPLNAKHTLHSEYELLSFRKDGNSSSEPKGKRFFFPIGWRSMINIEKSAFRTPNAERGTYPREAPIRTHNRYGMVSNTSDILKAGEIFELL